MSLFVFCECLLIKVVVEMCVRCCCLIVHQKLISSADDNSNGEEDLVDCGDSSGGVVGPLEVSKREAGGRQPGGGWSRTLLKFGLVILTYTIAMGVVFYQLLEENQLDMVIRRKVPHVL